MMRLIPLCTMVALAGVLPALDAPLTILRTAPDTGIAPDDHVTRTVESVSGAAAPGAVIHVRAGSMALGPATVGSDGVWTLPVAATLPEGLITISATTGAGAGARGSTLVVRIDRTAPAAPRIAAVAPDTGTSATDRETSAAALAVSGSAEAGTSIEITAAGVAATAIAGADGAWTATLHDLPEGALSLAATAADAAGNRGSATIVAITIDRSPPAAPVVERLVNDTGILGDWVTRAAAPRLAGRAEGATTVRFVLAGGAVVTAPVVGGSWTADLPTLADGAHRVDAVAMDRAGNASGPVSTTVTVRTTTPPPAILVSDDTGTPGDLVTADATLVFSGTAQAGGWIALAIDGQASGTAAVAADGRWTIDRRAHTLRDGSRTVTATHTDAAGNTAATTVTLAIDAGRPEAVEGLAVVRADGRTGVPTTSADRLAATGSGPIGSDAVVFIDDREIAIAQIGADGTFRVPFGPLAAGTHRLVVYARDAAGNFSAPSATLQVLVEDPVAAPALSLGLPPAWDGVDRASLVVGPGSTVLLVVRGAPGSTVQVGIAGPGFADETMPVAVPADGVAIEAIPLGATGPITFTAGGATVQVDIATPPPAPVWRRFAFFGEVARIDDPEGFLQEDGIVNGLRIQGGFAWPMADAIASDPVAGTATYRAPGAGDGAPALHVLLEGRPWSPGDWANLADGPAMITVADAAADRLTIAMPMIPGPGGFAPHLDPMGRWTATLVLEGGPAIWAGTTLPSGLPPFPAWTSAELVLESQSRPGVRIRVRLTDVRADGLPGTARIASVAAVDGGTAVDRLGIIIGGTAPADRLVVCVINGGPILRATRVGADGTWQIGHPPVPAGPASIVVSLLDAGGTQIHQELDTVPIGTLPLLVAEVSHQAQGADRGVVAPLTDGQGVVVHVRGLAPGATATVEISSPHEGLVESVAVTGGADGRAATPPILLAPGPMYRAVLVGARDPGLEFDVEDDPGTAAAAGP